MVSKNIKTLKKEQNTALKPAKALLIFYLHLFIYCGGSVHIPQDNLREPVHSFYCVGLEIKLKLSDFENKQKQKRITKPSHWLL